MFERGQDFTLGSIPKVTGELESHQQAYVDDISACDSSYELSDFKSKSYSRRPSKAQLVDNSAATLRKDIVDGNWVWKPPW